MHNIYIAQLCNSDPTTGTDIIACQLFDNISLIDDWLNSIAPHLKSTLGEEVENFSLISNIITPSTDYRIVNADYKDKNGKWHKKSYDLFIERDVWCNYLLIQTNPTKDELPIIKRFNIPDRISAVSVAKQYITDYLGFSNPDIFFFHISNIYDWCKTIEVSGGGMLENLTFMLIRGVDMSEDDNTDQTSTQSKDDNIDQEQKEAEEKAAKELLETQKALETIYSFLSFR